MCEAPQRSQVLNLLTIILFLEPEWALSQQPMRLKAKQAIDSEAHVVGQKYQDKIT